MKLVHALAEYVVQTETIPASTNAMVGNVVLDLMAATIAGTQTASARASRTSAVATWGMGTSTVWFSDLRLPPCGAAFANSTAASSLDLDDGHRAAAGHPGAAIIPAVLAEAENGNYTGEEIAVAIALGYEIAVRISASRDLNTIDTLVSGRWCAQGVAAAIGWLRGLSSEELVQALAIAHACAPNLNAVAYSDDMGNHVKEGIPWATVTGMSAVNLAFAKSTGPTDFLDNPKMHEPSALTSALGQTWKVEGVYFKPYSCCRWAHAAMDAFQTLQANETIELNEITQVTIRIFSRALQLNNDVSPQNLEAAQYSIPFCVALVGVRGASALLPLNEKSLNDEEVLRLSTKIKLESDTVLDSMFPEAVPAEVTISTRKTQYTHRVTTPKGEPSNPMSRSDLFKKFDNVSANFITSERNTRLKQAIDAFAQFDLCKLRNELSIPLSMARTESAASPGENL